MLTVTAEFGRALVHRHDKRREEEHRKNVGYLKPGGLDLYPFVPEKCHIAAQTSRLEPKETDL